LQNAGIMSGRRRRYADTPTRFPIADPPIRRHVSRVADTPHRRPAEPFSPDPPNRFPFDGVVRLENSAHPDGRPVHS
jgi:hypothetical protein